MNAPFFPAPPAAPARAAPAGRLPYEPPCVEWLGNLQALTRLQQSLPITPALIPPRQP